LNLDLHKFREQRDAVLKVVDSLILSHNRATLLRIGEEMNDVKNKDNYNDYLDILQTIIHDIWTLNLNQNSENIINQDMLPELKNLSQSADRKKLSRWLKEIETLRENFTVNLNKKIATDALFMQMAN
jgi:hypothetical protein